MPWDIRRDFHLDIDASYGRFLLTSATDSSLRQPPPDMIAGDKMPVRFHFWTRNPDGTLTAADPGPDTSFVFSGRPAGVPAGSALLFMTDDFVEIATGIWEGTLDLTPTEFADHLEATPTGSKLILGELEVRDSIANTARNSFQFDLTARPQVYQDDATPLGLPTPEAWLLGSTAPVNDAYAYATGTFTFSGVASTSAGVTIGGVAYTFIAATTPTNPRDVATPTPTANATTWAAALAARINAWHGGGADANVTATSSGGVVTVTARVQGPSGSGIALTENSINVSCTSFTTGGSEIATPATLAPPYLRTAGGFLYIQEAGVWKKAALSAL